MMNSSRVIKSSRDKGANSIMTSRRSSETAESGEGGFHSLSSMWQSDDEELGLDGRRRETAKERLMREAEAVKAETEAMVAAAQARVAQIEQDARDKGFAAGMAEAKVQEKESLAKITADFEALLAGIEGDRQRLYVQYEADVLTLIKAMVDRVLFHEVTVNPQAIEVCLKTALSYVVDNSNVKIRLHAQDLERLKQAAMDRPEILAGFTKIELIEDPAILLGGCALETGFGEIDATLESRRDKVCAAIDAILQQAVKRESMQPS
jgi:flagellar assembly protein FliH